MHYVSQKRGCLTISMLVLSMMIGSLSNGDDSDKETLFAQLWLFCDFLILFAFFNAGEERNSSIGVRAAEDLLLYALNYH